MIVKMNKYSIVVHTDRRTEFLERLQQLGLVDITVTGWEPDEQERELLSQIDSHHAALEEFKALTSAKDWVAAKPYNSGEQAYAAYVEASEHAEQINTAITKANKELEEIEIWGDTDLGAIENLAQAGVEIGFYQSLNNEFLERSAEWSEQRIVEPIAEHGSMTYFVCVTTDKSLPDIDAQPMRRPDATATQKRAQIETLNGELAVCKAQIDRCASTASLVEDHCNELKDRLSFSRVEGSVESEAEGRLVVMQGWAPVNKAAEVDGLLDQTHDLVYIKERPTPEDDTPVLLKNNRYARLFELVGNFYELPRYGTMDLTPYFAPWYMIFFGFCLGDAGYGALFILIALLIKLKKMKGLSTIASLTMWLGGSTVLFGLLTGNVFGIQLAEKPIFDGIKFLDTNTLFYLSLGLGVVQILFGMVLNVVNTSRVYGFKYSLGTLGWLIILLSALCMFGLPMIGIECPQLPFYITAGIGAVMMLLLNNPDRNPLINLGSGLWNTYNNVTGLLGDVLSYVRLFALCLSGSALAIVFNSLAASLAPDIPVVKQLVAMIILLIGHGMNMFMSTIGAFAHPMRLTFVEFYKNAGFVAADRAFSPFKKEQTTNQ